MHFAVINQDLSLCKLLIENGATVQGKYAVGDFLYSNIGLYFGGSVLGFAACLNNTDIVEYLMDHGAHVNVRDVGPSSGKPLTVTGMKRGNTVLHCCVLHERADMFRHLQAKYSANPFVQNDGGDTPCDTQGVEPAR